MHHTNIVFPINFNLSIGSKPASWMLMLAILIFSYSGLTAGNLDGRWIPHPAAALRSPQKESQVDRIIEGNRYVYFSVRGGYVNRSYVHTYTTIADIDPLALFRYDKTQAWRDSSIKALAQEFELSGIIPVALNYSSSAGVMAVVYENNAIDFIYDDGTLIASQALSSVTVPYQTAGMYSISFDEEKSVVYVAGSFGFAAISMLTGELENYVRTDKSVFWAARVGSNIVVFAGEMTPASYKAQTYLIPADTKGNCELRNPIDGLNNLQAVMPLTESSFAAIASTSDTAKSLNLYTIDNDAVSSKLLVSGITADNGATWQYRHLFHTDGYIQQGKDGYVVHSKDKLILLNKAGETDTIDKATLSATEQASKAASFDGSRLWLFTYADNGTSTLTKRGFYYYENNGGKWESKSETAAPNAPTCTFVSFADWNPDYGLLVRGAGTLFNNAELEYDKLCGYKDGIWTDYSHLARKPSFRETTLSAVTIKTDPLNSAWIWGNSNRRGLHRLDLDNYDNFFELGSDHYSGYPDLYPGYYPVFKKQISGGWAASAGFIKFTNVDFDNENRMWFLRSLNPDKDDFDIDEVVTSYTPVYYLTAEEREMLASGEDDKCRELLSDMMKREILVRNNMIFENGLLVALKSPCNSNFLFATHKFIDQNYSHPLLYDHAGTPGDRSDDRFLLIQELYDDTTGEKVTYLNQTGLYEDISTGELWLFTSSGPLLMNPSDLLDGRLTCRRLRITRRNGMEVDENPFEFISIKYISEDNIGRKWMATENGLFCLSQDNHEVLAHYTVDNSPLPSNDVFNVICSPEGSVFILTSRGLAEFRPEGSVSRVAAGNHLSIWPSTVAPDYNGYVTVSGAETGSEYVVCDKVGSVIVSLGKPDISNTLQWDCRDAQGRRLPVGKYNIRRKSVDETNPVTLL